MENFFGIMKSEFLYSKEFESVEQFKIELEKYITYYNTKRMKAKLKMSPVEYEGTEKLTFYLECHSIEKIGNFLFVFGLRNCLFSHVFIIIFLL